ncbi:MAG: dihydroorotate dehydrogenase electron transfer subunit [Clostridiales Family XIII bacterium]|nr:dihydroorotate dehydrogenase electron transfer subunit [Clostridiales Family XIII bacterium]
MEIASGVYRLTLADSRGSDMVSGIVAEAAPGQFVNVYLNSASMLLPRPFGISDVVASERGPRLVLVYAVVGAGTAELSTYAPGAAIRILGPQGNGYELAPLGKNVLLIGGGLGIPPLLFATRRIRERLTPGDDTRLTALLGYRDAPYYSGGMGLYCDEVFSISETASGIGEYKKEHEHKKNRPFCVVNGTVMDLAARLVSDGRLDLTDASILSCGPMPMLCAVAEWAKSKGIPAQVSLEARMGCGYGACVGCTIEVKPAEPIASAANTKGTVLFVSPSDESLTEHPSIAQRKVCKDGPVFPAEAIVW